MSKIPGYLMRLWLAYLTWRFIKWGSSEGFLLCSFAFLEGARMIAGALRKSPEPAQPIREEQPEPSKSARLTMRPA